MEELMLILMVGLPRSGKSTWARKQGHPIVSSDAIRLAIHGKRFHEEAEPLVHAFAFTMANALFKAGHTTVIIDECNVTEKRRTFWKDKFKNHNVVLKIIDASETECKERATRLNDPYIIPIIERMAEEWDISEMPV